MDLGKRVLDRLIFSTPSFLGKKLMDPRLNKNNPEYNASISHPPIASRPSTSQAVPPPVSQYRRLESADRATSSSSHEVRFIYSTPRGLKTPPRKGTKRLIFFF